MVNDYWRLKIANAGGGSGFTRQFAFFSFQLSMIISSRAQGRRCEGFVTDINRGKPLIRPVGHLLP